MVVWGFAADAFSTFFSVEKRNVGEGRGSRLFIPAVAGWVLGIYPTVQSYRPLGFPARLCHHSDSKHAMPFSHILNAGNSTPSMLSIICQQFQLSASLEERLILMEELISTLSLTLVQNTEQETPDDLMWRAVTRTFNLAAEHRRRCSTMRSRMETLSQEDSSDLVEMEYQRLMIHGIEFWMQKMLIHFGNWFEHWLQGCSSPTSTVCGATASGTIDPRWLHTSPHPALCSTYQVWRSSANSYVKVCLEHIGVSSKNIVGSAGEGWSSGNSGAPPAPDPSPQPAPCDY